MTLVPYCQFIQMFGLETSPYEINLWLPLVNCFKTKSMYLLHQNKYKVFESKLNKTKNKSSLQIYKKISKQISWMDIKYGSFFII